MPRFNVESLQKTIEFLYNELEALTNYAEDLSLPVIGNSQYFPRPTMEARTLRDKVSLLEEQINDTIAVINTLIEIDQQDLKTPPLLRELMEREVTFYVDYCQRKNQENLKENLEKE